MSSWMAAQCSAYVSIPFIAGQWSLLEGGTWVIVFILAFQSPSLRGSGRFILSGAAFACSFLFQSPSLRGSGRFKETQGVPVTTSIRFNPLHCGAVVASHPTDYLGVGVSVVSIPFIAGQWSLPFRSKTLGIPNSQKFQSPSLRGSGRFKLKLVSMTSFS